MYVIAVLLFSVDFFFAPVFLSTMLLRVQSIEFNKDVTCDKYSFGSFQ